MKIKKILISQPAPPDLEKSPYRNLIHKHNVDITFFKFFEVVGIPASEFRKTRIHISDYTAIIFNSKNSIDHFFRMLKELRETVSEDMKYFCSTEAIALYLQTYIQYRKRKVFFGNQYFSDLLEVMNKHRDEKFLFPCSDEKQTEYTKALDKAKFKYAKAPMYTSAPRDLRQFNIDDFDAIALFSPIGVRSLVKSFPDIKNHSVTIAAFGSSTHAALKEQGIKLTIAAPTQSAPSMAMAIENYILGKEPESVIASKGEMAKHGVKSTITSPAKKSRPVIANKEVYKHRMEEKKALAAARRAERAAENGASRVLDESVRNNLRQHGNNRSTHTRSKRHGNEVGDDRAADSQGRDDFRLKRSGFGTSSIKRLSSAGNTHIADVAREEDQVGSGKTDN